MRHLVLTRNTQGKYKKKYKTLTKHKVNIAKINNTFYSVSLLIDTMPVRMAAIQKSTSNKCWRGCGEKGTLLHCWWECKLVQPLWRTVWRLPKNLEIELSCDPAIPLLGKHTEETRSERDTCTPIFIAALINSQDMEAT